MIFGLPGNDSALGTSMSVEQELVKSSQHQGKCTVRRKKNMATFRKMKGKDMVSPRSSSQKWT